MTLSRPDALPSPAGADGRWTASRSGLPSEGEAPDGAWRRRRGSTAQALVLTVLRAYQVWRTGHPSPCRFYPTCSAYAVEAVSEHGARRGAWLAIRRVARCHPFGRHGIDLVPPVRSRGEGGR